MQASSAGSDAKYSRTMYKCVNSDYLEAQQYLDTTRCHGNAAIRLRQQNTALSKTPDDPGTLLFSLNTCAALFDWTLKSATLWSAVVGNGKEHEACGYTVARPTVTPYVDQWNVGRCGRTSQRQTPQSRWQVGRRTLDLEMVPDICRRGDTVT